LAPAHARCARARHPECATQIDVDNLVPIVITQFPHHPVARDPGSIHQDVGAQVLGFEVVDQVLDTVHVAHVQQTLVDANFVLSFGDIERHHSSACAGELSGDGTPDS
jgi:hypothetical protein